MRKKKVKLHRRFSNYVQARFDTVGNKYLFKGEAPSLFINSYSISGISPVIDNMGVCNSGGIEELPPNRVESSDKVSNDLNCVVEKSVDHNFNFNDFAKTFVPKCECIAPISGRSLRNLKW